MPESAVVTPPAFTIARPQPGEYAPYYDRYISLIVQQARARTFSARLTNSGAR